jgi:hypothetical protein
MMTECPFLSLRALHECDYEGVWLPHRFSTLQPHAHFMLQRPHRMHAMRNANACNTSEPDQVSTPFWKSCEGSDARMKPLALANGNMQCNMYNHNRHML